ncbi:hypothetical protein BDV25DRAFT_140527 [Aspergillus avenaceus]|uniref:Uncharacterized protein n=1 Tax=Aspergillus avenaceus TaxID=36643 RepID=A0A5N6TTP4_ASPAV|nr:hypothetical protein BDV25DRAFT_140527 [Aspergillus avenaceus]
MRVTRTMKYIFRLSSLTRRDRSVWKGKEIEVTSTPPVAVTVHCHDDDDDDDDSSECEMAVNHNYNHSHSHHHNHNLDLHHDGSSSSRNRLGRVVSWASVVCDQCRWTTEQERQLAVARRELARCQKAWSSEQELWLTCIEALAEEKEAHEEFLLNRAKQQDDEQQHFRKAWNRRRSSDEQLQNRSPSRGLGRLRKRATD